MFKIVFLFAFFCAFIENGFSSIDDSEPDIFLMGDNMDKKMIEGLTSQMESDMELFKSLMPDEYEPVDPNTKQIIQQVLSNEYSYMIENLANEEEFMYMLKMAAIRKAVEEAFEKSVGKIEQRYVDELINMIENEVQLYKQRKSLEKSNNEVR